MFTVHLYISFGEMAIKFFAHFQNWIVFVSLSYESSLYILDTRFLLDTWFANIFSHSLGCLFTSLRVSRYFFLEPWNTKFKKNFFNCFCVVLVCLCPLFFSLQLVYLANLSQSLPWCIVTYHSVGNPELVLFSSTHCLI